MLNKLLNNILPYLRQYFVPLLGILAIILLVIFFILPTSQKIQNLENQQSSIQNKIDNTNSQIVAKQAQINKTIRQQKKAKQLKHRLEKKFESLQEDIKETGTYNLPDYRPYTQALLSLPEQLSQIAEKQGLQKISVTLGDKSNKDSYQLLSVEISVVAQIEKLRQFIVSLLEYGYVYELQQIHIQKYLDMAMLQVSINIRLS